MRSIINFFEKLNDSGAVFEYKDQIESIKKEYEGLDGDNKSLGYMKKLKSIIDRLINILNDIKFAKSDDDSVINVNDSPSIMYHKMKNEQEIVGNILDVVRELKQEYKSIGSENALAGDKTDKGSGLHLGGANAEAKDIDFDTLLKNTNDAIDNLNKLNEIKEEAIGLFRDPFEAYNKMFENHDGDSNDGYKISFPFKQEEIFGEEFKNTSNVCTFKDNGILNSLPGIKKTAEANLSSLEKIDYNKVLTSFKDSTTSMLTSFQNRITRKNKKTFEEEVKQFNTLFAKNMTRLKKTFSNLVQNIRTSEAGYEEFKKHKYKYKELDKRNNVQPFFAPPLNYVQQQPSHVGGTGESQPNAPNNAKANAPDNNQVDVPNDAKANASNNNQAGVPNDAKANPKESKYTELYNTLKGKLESYKTAIDKKLEQLDAADDYYNKGNKSKMPNTNTDDIYSMLYNSYMRNIDAAGDDKTKINNIQREFVQNLQNLGLDPESALKLSINDRLIFCLVLLLLKNLSSTIVEMLIDNGYINNIIPGIIVYSLIFGTLLGIIILFVNYGGYMAKATFLYMVVSQKNSYRIAVFYIILIALTLLVVIIAMNVNTVHVKSNNDKILLISQMNITNTILFVFQVIVVMFA